MLTRLGIELEASDFLIVLFDINFRILCFQKNANREKRKHNHKTTTKKGSKNRAVVGMGSMGSAEPINF